MSQPPGPSAVTSTEDLTAWKILFEFLVCNEMGLPQAELMFEVAGIDSNDPRWRKLLNAINDLEPDSDSSSLYEQLLHGMELAEQQTPHMPRIETLQPAATQAYRPAYQHSDEEAEYWKAKHARNIAESERIAERIRDEVVSLKVHPRILTTEAVHHDAVEAPPEQPTHSEDTFELPGVAQRARLWSVAFFHPYYATAMAQLCNKRLQRARLYGGYAAAHNILREVYHPNIPKEFVTRLIEWRTSSPANCIWPCPMVPTDADDIDQFADLPSDVRSSVYLFEWDVMSWARRRIEETEWCIMHLQELEAAFFAAGNTLPPTLVPPPAPRLPPRTVARDIQWLHPNCDSTHSPTEVAKPSDKSFRPWVNKRYLIVHEEDVTEGKGAIICVSNVSYWIRPPPNTHPVRRIDGTYGEHDETLRPSWVQFGQESKAFQPSARFGLWQSITHSDLRQDMLFYFLDWSHLVVLAPQSGATRLSGQPTYRLGQQLRSSLEACMRQVIREAEHWGRVQAWTLPTQPFETMTKLPQTFVFLSTTDMTKRHVIENLAMFQRYGRVVRGWSNWNRRLSEVAEMRRQFEHTGRAPAADTDHELLPVTGGHTRSYDVACELVEMSAPTWYYTRVAPGWRYPPGSTVLQEARVPYETQQWSDADTQVLPFLRPLRELDAALSRQLGTRWRSSHAEHRTGQPPIGDIYDTGDMAMHTDDDVFPDIETSHSRVPMNMNDDFSLDIEEASHSRVLAETTSTSSSLRKRRASRSPDGHSAKWRAGVDDQELPVMYDDSSDLRPWDVDAEVITHDNGWASRLRRDAVSEQQRPIAHDNVWTPQPTSYNVSEREEPITHDNGWASRLGRNVSSERRQAITHDSGWASRALRSDNSCLGWTPSPGSSLAIASAASQLDDGDAAAMGQSSGKKRRNRVHRMPGTVSRADSDLLERGEAFGRKVHIEQEPANPPAWYPRFYQPAMDAARLLEDNAIQDARAQRLASPSTPFRVSQMATRRWCKRWRVMPTNKLVVAPQNEHKVFSFVMALHPFVSTHIASEDPMSDNAVGLTSRLWKDASTFRAGGSMPWIETRYMLLQMGMKSTVDQVEGVVATVSSSNAQSISRAPYDLDDEEEPEDWTPYHAVDPTVEEWDPRYFCQDLRGDVEEHRYLYEPTGWRFKERNQRRKRTDYKWYFPGDFVEGLGAETYEFENPDVLEWQEILPTNKEFTSKLQWSDIWECYDHALVLLLPRHGDELRERATGERFLKPSSFYSLGGQLAGAGGKRKKRWIHEPGERTKPLVYTELSCWHGHDEKSGLAVPTDPLGFVGMYSSGGTKFTLPASIAKKIYPALALPSPDAVAQPRPGPQAVPPPPPVPSIETTPPSLAQLTALQSGIPIVYDGIYAGIYNPPESSGVAYDWPATPVRRRAAFINARMQFCCEVLSTDSFARKLFADKGDLQAASNLDRRTQVMQVWGGGGIGIYEGLEIVSPSWRRRVPGLRALHEVMQVWPHTALLPFPDDAELQTEQDLQPIEAHVWATYAQSYYDFYARKPAFPPVFDPSAPAGSPTP